jgi:hypothetical protein
LIWIRELAICMMSPDRADSAGNFPHRISLLCVSAPLFLRAVLFFGAIESFFRWLGQQQDSGV